MLRHQGSQRGNRHINPHDHERDNTTLTFTGKGISEGHTDAISTTAAQGLSKKVRTVHRLCICHSIKFLLEQYPTIYAICTTIMSQKLCADPMNYYMEKNIRHLVYSGLDPQYISAFLSQMHYCIEIKP